MHTSADEDTLDSVNQSMADGLSSKVSQLKSLAFDLDAETRDHIPLLDGIDDDVESSRVRLGGSSSRLRNIGLTRGLTGRRLSCYIGLSFAFLLVFFYYVIIPHVFQ